MVFRITRIYLTRDNIKQNLQHDISKYYNLECIKHQKYIFKNDYLLIQMAEDS